MAYNLGHDVAFRFTFRFDRKKAPPNFANFRVVTSMHELLGITCRDYVAVE